MNRVSHKATALVWNHPTKATSWLCLIPARTASLLPLAMLLLFLLPIVAQAQFTFTTNNGAITITGYIGSSGDVTIPSTINGLPVTSIGNSAFQYYNTLTNVVIFGNVTNIGERAFWGCTDLIRVTLSNGVTDIGLGAFFQCYSLIDVTIPDSVTRIGNSVFCLCSTLTNVVIPNTVTNVGHAVFNNCTSLSSVSLSSNVTTIGQHMFDGCASLTNITIPNSVTSIDFGAFLGCSSLTNIQIPAGVTSIEGLAFMNCTNLNAVYVRGNAPSIGLEAFYNVDNATIYYLPGTTGWSAIFGDRPTALWFLPTPLILNNSTSFSMHTNAFGFIISWATNIPVVVEATTNLTNPIWSPLKTNTLTGGSSYFSDPAWMNCPSRFYRLRSP